MRLPLQSVCGRAFATWALAALGTLAALVGLDVFGHLDWLAYMLAIFLVGMPAGEIVLRHADNLVPFGDQCNCDTAGLVFLDHQLTLSVPVMLLIALTANSLFWAAAITFTVATVASVRRWLDG